MWAEENAHQVVDNQLVKGIDNCRLVNFSFVPGNAQPDEKPSDFAGIWKNRKKVDAKKLQQRAWARRII